jgi:2-polyprenyl-6-methoxyphenol hydroxylase-like FAD-dependent oxidoreductase
MTYPKMSKKARNAVVIGAGMAGIIAARVLADRFDQVTIIERDRLPDGPEFRKGIPQARHVHVILMRCRLILEQLFPGLEAELYAAGAQSLNYPGDIAWLSPVGWSQRFHSYIQSYSCSRGLLEWSVRRRLDEYSNIRFLTAWEVVGLLMNASRTQAMGVQARSRDDPAMTESIHADLVVDASGRSSQTPQWLVESSYPRPQETVINAHLGYASRCYLRPTTSTPDWKAIIIQGKPPTIPRSGVLFPIEHDRWIVSVMGVGSDQPPDDETGFLEFARGLHTPLLYEAIKDAEPASPIYRYRRTENRLVHYERVSQPEGLVVLGDAACAFNPAYGQGMTIAALGAQVLGHCLDAQRDTIDGLAKRFQRQLARANTTPWLMATGEDFRHSTTEGGRRSALTKLTHWYLNRVLLLAAKQPRVYTDFVSVAHLLRPPTTLFSPRIAIQVLIS